MCGKSRIKNTFQINNLVNLWKECYHQVIEVFLLVLREFNDLVGIQNNELLNAIIKYSKAYKNEIEYSDTIS